MGEGEGGEERVDMNEEGTQLPYENRALEERMLGQVEQKR